MPKLPVRTPKQLIKLLEDRGFVLDRVKGSHPHLFASSDKASGGCALAQARFADRHIVIDLEASRH